MTMTLLAVLLCVIPVLLSVIAGVMAMATDIWWLDRAGAYLLVFAIVSFGVLLTIEVAS